MAQQAFLEAMQEAHQAGQTFCLPGIAVALTPHGIKAKLAAQGKVGNGPAMLNWGQKLQAGQAKSNGYLPHQDREAMVQPLEP